MTTTQQPQATRRQAPGVQVLAWAVLVTAVLQVVAPAITINGPGSSPGGGSGPELLITPVGWAFSIWGVIYALAIAQAIAVLVRGASAVSRRQQIDQIVLQAGAVVWTVLAGLDSSTATAAALVVMAVAAIDGVITVGRDAFTPTWFAVLTRAAVGLFAGWVTAACFLNVSTALVDADAFAADQVGWQIVVLVVAAATLLAVLVAARGVVAYAVAGAWAMIGIAVTGNQDGTGEVVVVALVAIALLGAVLTLLLRRSKS